MQIPKLKTILILLCPLLLGACTKTIPVLVSPPSALFELSPEPVEPAWELTGDLLESRDLWRQDSKFCRAQVGVIKQWYVDMLRQGVKEK